MFNRRWQSEVLADNQPDISKSILEALQNDLNTSKAISIIDKYFDKVDQNTAMPNKNTLIAIRDMLGIDFLDDNITNQQKQLISERDTARTSKDWQKSDRLRDQLKSQRIELNDIQNGTIWFRT